MKLLTQFVRKKRAISPVIAVILLIGLAVAAAAVIFLVVLPLLEPTSNLEMTDAFIEYDDAHTTASDEGVGYGKGTVVLSNAGTGEIEVTKISIYHSTSISGPWTEMTNAVSLQSITTSNPWTLEPLAYNDELTVRFPIPTANYDNSMSYKIIVETKEGDQLDTSTQTVVDETDMQLAKDRPDISFTGTLDYVRRTQTISPTSVSDNSEIKNVTYQVSNATWSTSVATTSSLWQWQWATYNTIFNGSYNMNITVYDYAGLSASTFPDTVISFTIDNDYVSPTINYIDPEADWAEVGETFEILANIEDTGSGASDVGEAYLHYRLLNETTNSTVAMTEGLGNNWTASIPVDSRALEVNLTYSIDARDLDNNQEVQHVSILEANDTVEPDITHTPLVEADEQGDVIISAIIEDPGIIDTSKLFLTVRKSNNLGANATVSGKPLPSSWLTLDPTTIVVIAENTWNATWKMPQPSYNVTIHGLEYYINATDKYGTNTAQHGTASVPHPIEVLDLNPPDFVGISTSNFPSSWTENTDYPISVQINDNDPTFGRVVNGDMKTYATGKVTIHFKEWNGDPSQTFTLANINQTVHTSGNSSTGEITTWFGIIPNSVFVYDVNHRVDFYITTADQSKTDQDQHSVTATRWPASGFYSIDVKEAGQPNVIYSPNSIGLKNNNETVFFTINNTASSLVDADAILTDMYLEIFSSDWDFSNGEPNLTKVLFTRYPSSSDSYNDTAGSPHPWDGNGTWVMFDSDNLGEVEDHGDYNIIELTFSNTSSGLIDMHNMILNVSFKAKVGANDVDDQWLGLFATPGVEPESALSSPYDAGGDKYYINRWLVTPLYPYGSQGLGWDSDDASAPWMDDYTRTDVSSGLVKPYDGFGVTLGSGTPNDEWNLVYNNEGYRMNIDILTGGATNQYLWFYSVILISGGDTSATMYLGSDDEAVCYINGQLAGSYGSPRGYGETPFTVNLLGNNQNNYILFGVHEDAGGYYGGLAFQGAGAFQIKTFTGPPPPPLSPIQSTMMMNLEDSSLSSNPTSMFSIHSPQDVQMISTIQETRDSIFNRRLKRK